MPRARRVYGLIVKSKTFRKGDIVCSVKAMNQGYPIWFKAGTWDVKNWSGRQEYYKLKFQ